MKLYWSFLANDLNARMAYRFDALVGLAFEAFLLVVSVSVWKGLYRGGLVADSVVGPIALTEMVTYAAIGTVVRQFVPSRAERYLNQRVRSGEVAIDFVKPYSIGLRLFMQDLANSLYAVVFRILPLVVVAILAYSIRGPQLHALPFFLLALFNALVMSFFISFLIGCITFWYNQSWQFRMMLYSLIAFFTGSFIPLWFFPPWLFEIARILPFRLLGYSVIAIYQGKLEIVQMVSEVAQQFLWIGILFLLASLVWTRAQKRLFVQGG